MQAGVMYFKIVTRQLQGTGRSYQFMILAGFTSKLSHSTAQTYETLSPNHMLRQEEIVRVVEKLRLATSAASVQNITNPDVERKLQKLFDIGGTGLAEVLPSFAALGIGTYLDATHL